MNKPCDCCDGQAQLTPMAIANRPGLSGLAYRVGTHGAFLETMKARLSNFYLDIQKDGKDEHGRPLFERIYPLRDLTTRAADDPSIALLDAWAIIGDVLSFYQERIANEGYLRTATERRSILDLARLVGYTLRPGVAATVYLAYTLDSTLKDEVIIPAGTRAQSLPGPGELPQSFETGEPLVTRAAWNVLKPRMTKPQTKETIEKAGGPRIYLKGISTNLKPNDPLLIDYAGTGTPIFMRVKAIQPDAAADRTLVLLTTAATPETVTAETRRQLNDIITRYPGKEADRIGLSRGTRFGVVSEILGAVQKYLADAVPFSSIIAHVTNKTLPQLQDQHDFAARMGYSDLRPWLENMLTELNTVVRSASATHAALLVGESTLSAARESGNPTTPDYGLTPVLMGLVKPASLPPASEPQLRRSIDTAFQDEADAGLQIVGALHERLRTSLAIAVANTKVSPDVTIKVYALRVKAALFGHTISRQLTPVTPVTDGKTMYTLSDPPTIQGTWGELIKGLTEQEIASLKSVALDAVYDQITPGSFVAIDAPTTIRGAHTTAIRMVAQSQSITMEVVNAAMKVSVLTLEKDWLGETDFKEPWNQPALLRGTTVYAQSEELALAEEPIDADICGSSDASSPDAIIELDGVYSDLQAGRWLIVSGERTDIKDANSQVVPGVKSSELVMLAEVIQRVPKLKQPPRDLSLLRGNDSQPIPGEKTHTFIRLAQQLEYCYKRDTVTIYGNVAKATHGETRNEVLGSGDGSQALQAFTLKQAPLTFVAASNPRGVDSTLLVRVNDIEWQLSDTLADLQPTDRKFIMQTDDDDKTTVIFGNGWQGARLPTGIENVKAVYRSGIGKLGNVKATQISLLATRPLGVKEVINPLRASGGADRESRDQARKNAPLAMLALDRLVSTQDYEDFTRTFAGIGKANAVRVADGRRQLVFITIAGAEDIPIEKSSDLYRNLVKALRQFGDPHQPIQVELRELLLLVISANVRIRPGYLWEVVARKIRTQLLDTFSFERRELAQDVVLSEVISTIQSVEGVLYVDLNVLRGIPEKIADPPNSGKRRLLTPHDITTQIKKPLGIIVQEGPDIVIKDPQSRLTVNQAGSETNPISPAQIAFLTPNVPSTLILNQIT